MSILRNTVDAEVVFEEGNWVDRGKLIDEDNILTVMVSFGTWKVKKAGLGAPLRSPEV